MKILFSLLFVLSFGINVSAQKVVIITTLGEIVVELEKEKAPITVGNFIKYVEGGYYNGGSFFRTVHMGNQPDSPVKITVIQGGCQAHKQDSLYDPILLERTKDTGLKHMDGTISMARGAPDSAQDSFFICIGDQPELDFGGKRNPDGQGFAAFGNVIEGMNVVKEINQSTFEGQLLEPPIVILEMVLIN